MGIAAQVVEDMVGGAKKFFSIDDPWFSLYGVEEEIEDYGVSQRSVLTYKEERRSKMRLRRDSNTVS